MKTKKKINKVCVDYYEDGNSSITVYINDNITSLINYYLDCKLKNLNLINYKLKSFGYTEESILKTIYSNIYFKKVFNI